jgi:glycerol-3-phosphate dehydrogenase (NAD(P)+)
MSALEKDFKVGIVGAGAFGTTLAGMLARKGLDVVLWGYEEDVVREINEKRTNLKYLKGVRLPKGVVATTDISIALHDKAIVLVVVPSKYMRAVARNMRGMVDEKTALIHCAKGIEIETFKRMSEVIQEETGVSKVGVLSGPNFSYELARQKPAGTVIASKDDELVSLGVSLFRGTPLRVYKSHDVKGVEIGGAFKNIIAMAAGAVDGFRLGTNTRSTLICRGLSEMIRFGVALGARLETFAGLAGIGDLIVTCTSKRSRNYQVGFRVARGESVEDYLASMVHVAEGVTTCKAVYEQARNMGLELHIVHAVYHCLYANWSAKDALRWLLSNPTGFEIAFSFIEKAFCELRSGGD